MSHKMETFCLKNITINIGMIEKNPIYCHYAFKNIHINVDGTTRPCCEYNKIDTEFNLKWTLYNGRSQLAWPEGLQVIPVLCAPSVRMFFESDICALEP